MVNGLQKKWFKNFTHQWIHTLCYGALQYLPTLGDVFFPIPSFWVWNCNFLSQLNISKHKRNLYSFTFALTDPHHLMNTPMQENVEKSQVIQTEAILNKPAPRQLTGDWRCMSETRRTAPPTHWLTSHNIQLLFKATNLKGCLLRSSDFLIKTFQSVVFNHKSPSPNRCMHIHTCSRRRVQTLVHSL